MPLTVGVMVVPDANVSPVEAVEINWPLVVPMVTANVEFASNVTAPVDIVTVAVPKFIVPVVPEAVKPPLTVVAALVKLKVAKLAMVVVVAFKSPVKVTVLPLPFIFTAFNRKLTAPISPVMVEVPRKVKGPWLVVPVVTAAVRFLVSARLTVPVVVKFKVVAFTFWLNVVVFAEELVIVPARTVPLKVAVVLDPRVKVSIVVAAAEPPIALENVSVSDPPVVLVSDREIVSPAAAALMLAAIVLFCAEAVLTVNVLDPPALSPKVMVTESPVPTTTSPVNVVFKPVVTIFNARESPCPFASSMSPAIVKVSPPPTESDTLMVSANADAPPASVIESAFPDPSAPMTNAPAVLTSMVSRLCENADYRCYFKRQILIVL